MIKCLVFTKDRPLQFEAYVESLIFCSGIEEGLIHIIAPNDKEYGKLADAYRACQWFFENDFDQSFERTLSHVVARKFAEDDLILFGCDDVIYTRVFNLRSVELILRSLLPSQTIGFSLRLGVNIRGSASIPADNALFRSWRWRGKPLHFGYPFELMASVCPAALVSEILRSMPDIRTPNHLEIAGVQYCRQALPDSQLCMFNSPSYAVAQDVNRVQDFYQNVVHGTEEHSAENLLQLYRRGGKLDWTNLFGINCNDAFVGDQYWKIVQ